MIGNYKKQKGCVFLQFREQYGDYVHVSSGKVREIYQNSQDGTILLVATDRVSAFDQRLGVEIPDKGKILTAISAEFSLLAEKEWGIPTAYFSCSIDILEHLCPYGSFTTEIGNINIPTELKGRATEMEKLKMFPVEFIVRGYISGSAWKLYTQGVREICGVKLPEGLKNGSKLPTPIFTPTTKAPEGEHDKNITFDEMSSIVDGLDYGYISGRIHDYCLEMYKKAHDFALKRGVIIADTKFELGFNDESEEICFGDEILTPDSSRFWDSSTWRPGEEPKSYDKQIVRDYIAAAKARGEENPQLPESVVQETRNRYIELYERLFNRIWPNI